MKRILFVTFHLDKGGAEKIFTEVVSNIDNSCEAHVIVVKPGGVYEKRVKACSLKSYNTLHDAGSSLINRTILLRRLIKQIKPDKIISFLYYPNIITWLATRGLNVPILLSERDNPRIYLKVSFRNRILGILHKRAYRDAENIIAVSKKVGEFIAKDYNISEKRIIPIQNALDFEMLDLLKNEPISEFVFRKDKKYLIAVGRLEKQKNYEYMLEAFLQVKKKVNEAHLLILGEGKEENSLKSYINKLQLSGDVSFLGFQTNPHKFVKQSDVYLLSSTREGFPNSLLEAFYVNGHVVSTNCDTGPDEIISNEKDGLLAPLNDSEKFAELIIRMLIDQELREKCYKNSREKVKNFGQEIMMEKYKKLLLHDEY